MAVIDGQDLLICAIGLPVLSLCDLRAPNGCIQLDRVTKVVFLRVDRHTLEIVPDVCLGLFVEVEGGTVVGQRHGSLDDRSAPKSRDGSEVLGTVVAAQDDENKKQYDRSAPSAHDRLLRFRALNISPGRTRRLRRS